MKTQTLKILFIAFCIVSPITYGQARSSNNQVVIVQGSVLNTAKTGATAKVNIGSVVGQGKNAPSTNNQQIYVNGSVINQASGGGSKSEVNIGSVVNNQD